MTSLEGVNSQNALWTPHSKDKEITPWSTQQRLVRNGKDTVMDVTYTVKNMQTPPVAVLVPNSDNPHPQFHTPPILESGLALGVIRSHDNMTSVANIQVSPQNRLSVSPSSPVYARTRDFVSPMAYNGQRTTPNPPVLHEINREHLSPNPSESRHISLSQLLTTAEATTQALNAAFQTHGQTIHASLPHKSLQADITATTVHEGVESIPSQTSALEVQLNHSNLNDKLLRLTVAEPKEHDGELNNKPMEQHQIGLSSEAKLNDLRGQPSSQSFPSRTAENEKSPKRYVFEAVVVDERPPHHTGLVSPKRRAPQVGKSVPLIKTGPPKLRDVFIKTRRPKAETRILRSEEEVEQYLQAKIAPVRFATKNEAQAEVDATYNNVQILMAQWESRPRVQNSSKAPSIVYPASQPLEQFVDGIESAFGPGALTRIPHKRPKHAHNQRRYVYTSSEPDETEVEQVSDFPAEEDELIEDTTMEEAPPIAVPDVTQDGTAETMTREDGATLKRKLSASGDEDTRKHPRLQDGVPGAKSHRPGTKLDKDAIAKWVASLEVLIKGKVKLDRQDLRKLKQMLMQIYALKSALSVDDPSPNLEVSHLKSRIRQLSEMAAEDIPFNDDENIRHLAKKISRSWN